MKVDLERLREAGRAGLACVSMEEMAALLAVVDAARAATRREGLHGKYADVTSLVAALEPFTPAAGRAWEEVDRWNAERDTFTVRPLGFVAERDLAVKAAVDAKKANPRDRARDQLADAGVAVQRQFRSDQERIAEDQERIAELEAELESAAAVVSAARDYVRGGRGSYGRLAQAVEALDGSTP